jgi:hypothetical protein
MVLDVPPGLDIGEWPLKSGVSGMGIFPVSTPASDQTRTMEVLSVKPQY